MLTRPAVAQDPDNPSIPLSQDTPFQQSLREAVEAPQRRTAIEEAATAFVAGPEFIGDPADTPLGAELDELAGRLDEMETVDGSASPEMVREAIVDVFGTDPNDVIELADFKNAVRRLRDSLVAIKVLQEEHSRPIEQLARLLRTAEVIARHAADDKFPKDLDELRRWLRRSLRLPFDLGLTSRLSTREAEQAQRQQYAAAVAARQEEVDGLLAQHANLRAGLEELGGLNSEHFHVTSQSGSGSVQPPEQLRLTNVATALSAFHGNLRERVAPTSVIPIAGAEEPDAASPATDATSPATETTSTAAEATDEINAPVAQALLQTAAPVLRGRTDFQPTPLTEVGFVLLPTANEQLSAATRTLLTDRGLDLTAVPLDRLTHRLETDLAATAARLEAVAGHPVRQSLLRVGDALVTVQTPVTTGWGTLGTGGSVPLPTLPLDGRVPHTKGEVAPAGIADLLVVKQQLTGYESADVAHIENVLRGERKLRDHSRRDTTELITINEQETNTSEDRDLQTTDRFEMTRETEQTVKEDVALKAGLNVSGRYGPVVEFAASAEGSFARSKQEATKSAARFSQDVTERTSRKIAERVLTRTQLTTTTETIEKNTHELDNTHGNENISGVYQWVNKVYQAQLFNYGLRAMFDFMVPEPAAFLIASMQQTSAAARNLIKPPDFPLNPAQINEINFAYWVKQTGATDVQPPPELFKTKSLDFKAGGGDSDTNYNHSAQISIEEGYRAVYASVGVVRNIWEGDNTVEVVVGRRTQRMPGGDRLWTTTLDDERDTVAVAIDTFHVAQVAVAVEVKVQRTDRAMDKWRLETHAKLETAHKAAVADYEEKLAALQLRAGVDIQGRNPAANLALMQTELKKNCVSILTDQHYDLFDSIETSPANGLPEINVFEAAGEGPYVRFFEQAFEWEHVTFVTYPYFWGRKNQWEERLGFDDPDPAFADFLRAGFCRVSVPARPGFEGAIDHFLTFGEIWNGGPLPTISNPLYLPIADEIAERLDRPGTEVPQGDPWIVRVPTSLVKLRDDDRLPHWEQDADGEWVEV
ncbi:hypothetical protein [Nonomuraea aurantiaca]|uniref:hypothetical protein n=1 Tax=Nonomuraea aurantiaca TaxID=2878562 RepID=UPI001CDA2695|nr:hypothetical protein [Nonomuraea aurantiaca]MCA2225917.1 hypothetical protein [Nonomuraea aurantiaca]